MQNIRIDMLAVGFLNHRHEISEIKKMHSSRIRTARCLCDRPPRQRSHGQKPPRDRDPQTPGQRRRGYKPKSDTIQSPKARNKLPHKTVGFSHTRNYDCCQQNKIRKTDDLEPRCVATEC